MNTSTRQVEPRTQPALPAQAPRVVCKVADLPEAARCRLERPVTIIGSRRDCDLSLNHPEISKVHCAVVNTGRLVLVCDLCSRAGTFVNEQVVRVALLRPGDRLRLGPVVVQVEFEAPAADGAATGDAKLPSPLILAGREQRFEISLQAAVIGRRNTCDVALDTPDVSLAHALVFLLADAPAVYDLGSRSGTFVNGERAALTWLHPQDKLCIGGEELVVQWSGPCGGLAPPAPAANAGGPKPAQPAAASAPPPGGDLQDLEQTLAALHGHITASRAKLDERALQLDQRDLALGETARRVEAERAELEARRAEVTARAEETALARLGLERQKRDLEEAARACEKEKEEIQRTRAAAQAAQAQADAARAQVDALQAQTLAAQAQLNDARGQFEADRKRLEEERLELARRRTELDARLAEHEDAAACLLEKEAACARRQAELEAREQALAQREAALAQREALEAEAARKIELFKTAIQEATQRFGHAGPSAAGLAAAHGAAEARAATNGAPKDTARRGKPGGNAGKGDETLDKLPAPLVAQPLFAVPTAGAAKK